MQFLSAARSISGARCQMLGDIHGDFGVLEWTNSSILFERRELVEIGCQGCKSPFVAAVSDVFICYEPAEALIFIDRIRHRWSVHGNLPIQGNLPQQVKGISDVAADERRISIRIPDRRPIQLLVNTICKKAGDGVPRLTIDEVATSDR